MEIYKLPERRMYWCTEDKGIFKGLNYGSIITLDRFEAISSYLQFSYDPDADQQIISYLQAKNVHLKTTMSAGDYICIDESMVKSYHRDLKGKMKIK